MLIYNPETRKFAVCEPPMFYEAQRDGYVAVENQLEVLDHIVKEGIKLKDLECDFEDGFAIIIPPEPETGDLDFVHPNSVEGLKELGVTDAKSFLIAVDENPDAVLKIKNITVKTLPGLVEKAKEL